MRMSEPKQNLLDDKTEELLEVAFWEHDMEGKLKGDLCRSNRDAFKSQVRKVIRTLTPLNALAAEAHRIAVDHGFTEATIPEDIALMHSELSEALEDHRAGHAPTETWYEPKQPVDKPCGIPSEMADVVIRVAHFCGKYGIDLDKAVAEKMEYNATRPYKHGKVM